MWNGPISFTNDKPATSPRYEIPMCSQTAPWGCRKAAEEKNRSTVRCPLQKEPQRATRHLENACMNQQRKSDRSIVTGGSWHFLGARNAKHYALSQVFQGSRGVDLKHLYFTEQGPEAHKGSVTCPRPHSQHEAETTKTQTLPWVTNYISVDLGYALFSNYCTNGADHHFKKNAVN